MDELIHENPVIDYTEVAAILRDRYGKNGEVVGNGNEKALNQLIAHHSVIFKPEQCLVWVSVGPYQIGKYVCYDLNKVFDEYSNLKENIEITLDSLEIPVDDFIYSEEYKQYERFKELRKEIITDSYNLEPVIEDEFIQSNPHYYLTYYTLGDYYFDNNDFSSAKRFYNQALTKVLPVEQERDYLTSKLEKSEQNLRDK